MKFFGFFVYTMAGRPTKYQEEYCQMLIDFFDVEPYEEREINHYEKDGSVKWTDYKRMANKLPTIRDFAKKIDVHIDTIYEWLKVYEEFSEAYTRAQEMRKWFLIENGLNGCYNPAFAIFVAKNITDMKDTQDHNIGGAIKLELIKNATNEELSKIVKDGINARSSEGAGEKGTGEEKTQ